jgi:hypothetical protein
MAWQAPVTNRTAAAYLNAADLNRIDGNLKVLAGMFGIQVAPKVWTSTDWPTEGAFARLLQDATAVRAAYFVLPNTPALPQNPLTMYGQWNDLEENLRVLYDLWQRNQKNRIYAGELYAGGQIGVI